ncbi:MULTISPECIES: hypothetical protein [Micromonospora]|uniref:hypothetical protein n=1 Tax=Micromonospora TaxID=1873 RepID=UPI00098D582B|nr:MULTISPECIES: hypothetical protein [unclassified Micromonospora]OON28089.1 hypothetical protein BSA16_28420 [Micromonospora sp. Rc5]
MLTIAASVLVGLFPAAPALAVLQDGQATGQWNSQGQSQGGEGPPKFRWQTIVQGILDDPTIQVLAQEVGSAPPPTAQPTGRVLSGVVKYCWNCGTGTRPNNVFIYWTDVQQQRNGLATVTRESVVDARRLTARPFQHHLVLPRMVNGLVMLRLAHRVASVMSVRCLC